MDASVFRIVIVDLFNGFLSLLHGPVDLMQLKAAADTPPPPARPRERTVLQMRREREGKMLPQREEPPPSKKIDPITRFGFCAAINIGFALAMSLIVLPVLNWLCTLLPSALSPPEAIVYQASVFTLLPLYIITRLINVFCFADIASACYRRINRPEPPPIAVSTAAADFIASIILETVFLLQTALVAHLPLPGFATFAVFVHMSLLNSLYSFEYFWMSSGVPLHQRISRIERRWPFFLGFGSALTFAQLYFESSIIQGCIFGTFFPLLIISSYSSDWRDERLGDDCRLIPLCRIFLPSCLVTDKLSVYISEWVTGQRISRASV